MVVCQVEIGPAIVADVPAILGALEAHRADPSMFQRSEADLRANLADFIVARDASRRVLGCAGLHAHFPWLAELLSVAVLPECQGRGIGRLLTADCLRRAPSRGFEKTFLATNKPAFFARFGFHPVSRRKLPARVLLTELRRVFRQEPRIWLPALAGYHTFLLREVRPDGAASRTL